MERPCRKSLHGRSTTPALLQDTDISASWRVAGRHDSHHGLCEHATSSSARDDRARTMKAKLSTTHAIAR